MKNKIIKRILFCMCTIFFASLVVPIEGRASNKDIKLTHTNQRVEASLELQTDVLSHSILNYHFLIWICSSFKAWMALAPSKRACFVKLVKASTLIIISVVPIEGMNKAAIYSYHWNTDLVHLACKWGRFTRACCRLGFMLPWAKVNPGVQQPTQPIGNQEQRLGPQNHWVLLGTTQWIPGLYFQSEPGQWMN